MSLSIPEQFLLELINRARLDPLAEAARFRTDLNANLAPGTINGDAKQALAPNELLNTAADAHSRWMLANNVFSHTGVNNSTPGDRMATAGYDASGWRENLSWYGTTNGVNLASAITLHHRNLYDSESHRVTIFADTVREIGIGQVAGNFTYNGRGYQSSMLTEKFGISGSDVFVTGVAYKDANRDAFYSMGEGLAGIRFSTDGAGQATQEAGGYAFGVAPGGRTQMAASLRAFVHQNKRRGLAVLISDFYDPEGYEDAINMLRYNRFEPFAIQVVDPAEMQPQLKGDLQLIDCETGEMREITVSPALLRAYIREHERYCEELAEFCTTKQVALFRAETGIPFDELVLKIFRRGGFLR